MPAGDCDCLAKGGRCPLFVGLLGGEKKIAFEPVELRLANAGLGLLDLGEPFAHG